MAVFLLGVEDIGLLFRVGFFTCVDVEGFFFLVDGECGFAAVEDAGGSPAIERGAIEEVDKTLFFLLGSCSEEREEAGGEEGG